MERRVFDEENKIATFGFGERATGTIPLFDVPLGAGDGITLHVVCWILPST